MSSQSPKPTLRRIFHTDERSFEVIRGGLAPERLEPVPIPPVPESRIRPFGGNPILEKVFAEQAKRSFTPQISSLSEEVMAIKGIRGTKDDALHIYQEREQLIKAFEQNADLYISCRPTEGLPSIFDRGEAERAFWSEQMPVVQTAVHFGLIDKEPEPERSVELWAINPAEIGAHIEEKLSVYPAEQRHSLLGYLVTKGIYYPDLSQTLTDSRA